MATETVVLGGLKRRDTDKAQLITLEGTQEDVWIPFSVIDEMHTTPEGFTRVHVHRWWALKNDLE